VPDITLTPSESPSLFDTAFHHFFNSYIPGSSLRYLSEMLDEISSSKCFQLSVRAVGMANLARERKDSELMNISRRIHLRAIKETSLAIQSEASQNSTLVATLILSLFEVIVLTLPCNDSTNVDRCLQSWIAHTNGTMSLIRFRGPELLKTEFGIKTYILIASTIRTNCTKQRIRLPPEFVAMDRQVAPLIRHMDLTIKFWPIVDMVIDLCARGRGKHILDLVSGLMMVKSHNSIVQWT
jgi:Fungal specific transcription factor domain